MKTLFEFELTENTKLENGENKEKKHSFAILKPNTTLRESGEVFHAKVQSSLVAQGVLTGQMLRKRLMNDGGVLSEQEAKEIAELYESFFDLQNDYRKILVINEKDRTEEDNKRFQDLIVQLSTKSAEIQSYETSQIALFDNTAEVIARNRHIFWWVLHLAYEKNAKGEYECIFGNGDYESRKNRYDDILDDEFVSQTLSNHFVDYISMWYIGRAVKKEDFQAIFDGKIKVEKKELVPEVVEEKIKEKIEDKPL